MANFHLPHIQNVTAGINKQDPQHKAIFEVYFTLPAPIASAFSADSETLTQQVVSVAGLDALQKTVQASSQQFFGADVSFLNPTLDNTYADLTIVFNLNIREGHDAWVMKLLKAWAKIGYDIADGTRTLKADYMTDALRIAEGNRNGDIWRSYVFHNVMMTGMTGLDDLNYKTNDAAQVTCTFRADWWEEELA